jgi:hypothetical protein
VSRAGVGYEINVQNRTGNVDTKIFDKFYSPPSLMGSTTASARENRGKTSNNSNVLAPIPALKPLNWSVVAHSHRRLEGWIDTAKAVARYGLDYATLRADLAAGTAPA